MNRLWIALAAWGLAALPASAASPDPKDLAIPQVEMSRARELVRQLASEVYKEREQAQDELAKMGRLARPALSEALSTDPSPEIRARTSRLLPRAETADLQARIETFLADTEAKFQHDLPGWNVFRKEVATKEPGSDKAVRDLYVEAIKTTANLELLTALSLTPETAGRAIADRRVSLFLQQNPGAFGRIAPGMSTTPKQPTLADVAVLLFAESVTEGKSIPRPGPFSYITGAQFVQVPASMQAINNPDGTPHGKAYKQIFVKWIDTRISPEDLNNIAWIANNFKQIKETTPLLRRIVATDGVQGYAKGQALVFLVQRNGKDETPLLKSLLKNDSQVNVVFLGAKPGGIANQATCQMRDMALALLIAQSGQNLKDYFYEMAPGNVPNPTVNPYPTYAFTTDENRDKAMKKWAEWESKEQPKKDEPKK